MAAFVRVSGPPNSNFVVGYPGFSGTLPRIEGKVEIRPLAGVSAPVVISFVTISLQRRESIHPWAESKARRHLAAPRKEITDTVGKEMLLFRCSTGREHESVMAMDLPFVIFIPYGRGSEEVARRVPPASLQLSSRRAETFYELVVTVQQGPQEQRKYGFAVPISRYDLLSTFGMFDQQKSAELAVDNIVTLRISLPRWSYGPLDPVSVFIGLVPNSLALDKAKRVTVQKLTLTVEEEIVYNHEGDEPMHKTRVRATTAQSVNKRLPEAGYFTNLLVVFPHNDLRTDGIIPRGKKEFPLYMAHSFTTTGTLYKIEYYIVIKAQLSSARDITLKQQIIACPFDRESCKMESEAIDQALKDARYVSPDNPMLPAAQIIRASDPNGLRALGMTMVGGQRKPLIE